MFSLFQEIQEYLHFAQLLLDHMVNLMNLILYLQVFAKLIHLLVYVNMDDECHDLSFHFGQAANGVSAIASRKFSIKVKVKIIHNYYPFQ